MGDKFTAIRAVRSSDVPEPLQGFWPLVVTATHGYILWRLKPDEEPSRKHAENRVFIDHNAQIRLTCRVCDCSAAGVWLEVDPVWSPHIPPCLLEPVWLLWEGSKEEG